MYRCTVVLQMYTELMYNLSQGADLKSAARDIAMRMNLDLDKVIGPGFDDLRVVHR